MTYCLVSYEVSITLDGGCTPDLDHHLSVVLGLRGHVSQRHPTRLLGVLLEPGVVVLVTPPSHVCRGERESLFYVQSRGLRHDCLHTRIK